MTDAHESVIERFYRAFDEGDGAAMAACYAPDVRFSDPVFTDLRGSRAGAMWRMLTEGPGDLRVELLEHQADEARGSAHWRAHYTFTETGRPVVNDIHASFRFKDGLIAEHRDEFSFPHGHGRRSVRSGFSSAGRLSCARRSGARLRPGSRSSRATTRARGRSRN